MSRAEVIEWIVMIGIVVAWWPRIFFNYDPLWYHILIYYVSVPVLIIILIRRFRANEAGFRVSEEMMKAQRGGKPVDISQTGPRAKKRSRAQLPFMPDATDENKPEKRG